MRGLLLVVAALLFPAAPARATEPSIIHDVQAGNPVLHAWRTAGTS